MKKKVLTGSIKALIVLLLAVAVLVPKAYSQQVMAVIMIGWLIAMVILLCVKSMRYLRNGRHIKLFVKKSKKDTLLPVSNQEYEQDVEEVKPVHSNCLSSEHEVELMMQQISLRISEKLKSAYPDAVWKWCKKPSLSSVLQGATVRIQVNGMEEYSHADVTFDRFGRIHVEPMQIGSFGKADNSADEEEDSPVEPEIVDVRAWYELVGQKILEPQIIELNANGYSRLTIKENGDIVINRQKKEALVTNMSAFPEKSYWNELIAILDESELKAKIVGNTLQVSWII